MTSTEPAESTDPAEVSGATGHRYETTESSTAYTGRIISVRRDLVRMPDGDVSQRDVIVHPGAVGIVALDEDHRVVLVHQYRHPVGGPLWELPAGILDVAGEPASLAAARELAEETGLWADRYDLLVDVWSSPGMTDEAYRVFLARGLHEIPAAQRHVPEHEEVDMGVARVDLDEAVRQVQRGEITNGMAVIGLLAADRCRSADFTGLRPAGTPWPARPAHSG